MEFENILRLIDSVSASNLDCFVCEQNGTKIRLEKKKQKIQINNVAGITAEQLLAQRAAVNSYGSPATTANETGLAAAQNAGKTIASPLVGVFYAAPSEDAEPFVKAGDSVKKGQTVGIVEAMKLMNEITSDCDGVVREICVANAEAVEYAQPLFVIEEAQHEAS